MFDIIVVGAGLIGCAAARHLSAQSAKVALIGPAGPPVSPIEAGAFSSHDDASRIVRRTTRDLPWALLTDRSLRGYETLQRETGLSFFHHRSGVHLVPDGAPSKILNAAEGLISTFQLPCAWFSHGAEVRSAVPELTVPDTCRGLIEHPPAGYLEPHGLIAAQLQAATARGARVIRDLVVRVRRQGDHVEVSTHGQERYRARRVLVAMGSYTRHPDLLPQQLVLRVKSETTILAQVSEPEAARLSRLPTIVYERARATLGNIYLAPPLRYPDGNYYIKMGTDTFADRYLHTAGEMNDWMHAGASDVAKDEMTDALRGLIARLELVSVKTKRCLITYTAQGWPMVDQIDEGIFVATGGNGFGAKASDGIGALAAGLVMQGRWPDLELDKAHFAAQFIDSAAPQKAS